MAALSEQIGTEPHTRLGYFCSPISDRGATSPEIALLAEEWESPSLGIAQRAPELNDSLTVRRNR
jgi:hypothetical protein